MEIKYCKTKSEEIQPYINDIEKRMSKIASRYPAVKQFLLLTLLACALLGSLPTVVFSVVCEYSEAVDAFYTGYSSIILLVSLAIMPVSFFLLTGGKYGRYIELEDIYSSLLRVKSGVSASNDIEENSLKERVDYFWLDDTDCYGRPQLSLCFYDDSEEGQDNTELFVWMSFDKSGNVVGKGCADFTCFDKKFEELKNEISVMRRE